MVEPYWMTAKRARMSTERLLKTMSVLVPPVDIFDLAKRLHITVKLDHRLNCAGVVVSERYPPSATITIRASDGYRRQRFTLAHEIGHLILHPIGTQWRDDSYIGSSPEGRAMEAQANGYGAGLLMPSWMMEPVMMRGTTSVKDLADLFEVSEAAMVARIDRVIGGRQEDWSHVGR